MIVVRPAEARDGDSLGEIHAAAWEAAYAPMFQPDFATCGVAASLMTESLRSLRDNGYAEVHLWTLRSTPQSRRFYTKSGFTESGAVRTYDFGDGRPFDQLEYRRPVGPR